MNTLLNLMNQVWRRRTPARASVSASAAAPQHHTVADTSRPATQPMGDLWAWYQSRCTVVPEQEMPHR